MSEGKRKRGRNKKKKMMLIKQIEIDGWWIDTDM